MKKPNSKDSILKKTWYFLWHGDTVASWIANVVIAFVIIRFLFYPLLGIVLGTSFPVVAVISESMEHSPHNNVLCGKHFDDFKDSFDNYWDTCGEWYESRGITSEVFKKFPFKDGFEKGDVIILWRANKKNIVLGDILVFQGTKPLPIIHRVVDVHNDDGRFVYQTKGDHNSDSIQGLYGETEIYQERIFGKGVIRIPYLGWVKIVFVEAVKPFGIVIER